MVRETPALAGTLRVGAHASRSDYPLWSVPMRSILRLGATHTSAARREAGVTWQEEQISDAVIIHACTP